MTEPDETYTEMEEEENIVQEQLPHPVEKQKRDGRKKPRTKAQEESFKKMIEARKRRAEEQLALKEKRQQMVNEEVEEHIEKVKRRPKKKNKQVVVEESSIYTNGSNFQISNNVASNNNLVNISGTLAEFKSSRTQVVELHTSSIQAVNNTTNTIVSQAYYGWEFRSTGSRYKISFPGNGTYYPFIGAESSNPYFIHINNIGDAYRISGTSTSNIQHLFYGKVVINKELVANVDNASSNGRIGFQNFLAGYTGSIYPVLISEQQFGYFMSNTTPITGTGGSYDGYWGNGGVGNASDRRLKKNINNIENPIDIIKKLRGVNFEWICENKPKGTQIGYIAQEVKEVIPSIVDLLPTKDECCEDGTWGVQPANISAILVEGIKAQQTQIETLKTELDTYKSLMDKLINAPSFKSFKESLA